ncbi:MAG: DNA-directed RNA polymerase subunit alpha [Candidatus Poribacteria bacterium]|jgi:DNA-directed RNA polymerase subunit alpha|nr:DNA-directed RNA polymerase subunit alpha [Candidatus Poribacteria bacterium]MDP6961229.1 DNA-directed RNA polymerase subunit alpha [Dehalococcoidia bacterium]
MIGLEITKPKRLLAEQETLRPNYGKFIAEPLARGFGTTIGNSLRRVLLSSIEGAAIVAVSIDGISHEYDTIEGVREDVVQIILNLKAIRFLVYIEDPITLHLHAEGSGEVTAADITPSGQVEVINPDQHIAHLDRCDSLDIRLRVLRGRGYALAGEPLEDNLSEGVIPIDAKFSPVNKVNFKVEETRVGHITNFDRLLLEVWTDGSLTAKEAVTEAARILLDQLNLFTNFDEHYVEPIEVVDEEKMQRDKYLSKPVAELELSVRSANCLEASEITTIRDLVVHTEQEMLKQRNFGKKSLIEIREILTEMGLHLGMDLDDG